MADAVVVVYILNELRFTLRLAFHLAEVVISELRKKAKKLFTALASSHL